MRRKCEPQGAAKRHSQWVAIHEKKRHPVSKEALLDFKRFLHWRAYVLGGPPDDVRWAAAETTAGAPSEQEEAGVAQVAHEDDWLCDETQDDPE